MFMLLKRREGYESLFFESPTQIVVRTCSALSIRDFESVIPMVTPQ